MGLIQLPYDFTHREYQIEPWNAMLHPDYQRGVMVIPRRNGKDLLCWNALIAKAMERVGLYYYMAPYYNQVRQIIWEGFSGDGRRFLDYIPQPLIVNSTKLDMRIDLANGSQIKLQGSDNIDRIVGTNPIGIVFTEFSLHKPAAWEYLRPILAENGGWATFNGTPRGLNHFFDLYSRAQNNIKWYTQFLTRDDTGIPSLEAIEEDRDSGMPEELIQQEYYCSFLSGVVGAYYARQLQELRNEGHVTRVPYESRLPVFTFWDLGVRDATAIWFVQFHGTEIRLIDYYENDGEGLVHYLKILKEKKYAYAEHIAPHDMGVRDLITGRTRQDMLAQDYGIDFTIAPKLRINEGIEMVRQILPRCYFDATKTAEGFNALMSYKKLWNEKRQSYSAMPVHDWASHGSDAFRVLGMMIDTVAPYGMRMDFEGFGASAHQPRVLSAIPSKRGQLAA